MRDFRIPSFRRVDLGYARDSAPAPPKFHHVFISYTTREEEYKQVQEFSEVVVEELKRRGLKRDIAEFIWLDKLELSIDHRYRGKKEIDLYRGEEELEKALRGGLDASRKFLSLCVAGVCEIEDGAAQVRIRYQTFAHIRYDLEGPESGLQIVTCSDWRVRRPALLLNGAVTEPRGLIWSRSSLGRTRQFEGSRTAFTSTCCLELWSTSSITSSSKMTYSTSA